MKNILITGASGSLGRMVVAAFELEDQYHINIVCRDEVQESNRLKAFNINLLDEVAAAFLVQEIIETQKHIDAVVFLTGGFIGGDITQSSGAGIQKMMGLNVLTAHNIASPLININRNQQRKLSLVFIGAKAAMELSYSISNIAYALSKKALHYYVSLINESENKAGTSAFILLSGTLDTVANREAMPDADISLWTKPADIALCIKKIIDGLEMNTVIEL